MNTTILDYCRKADPIEIGNKLDISPNEVIDYLEIIQKDYEAKKLGHWLENIHGNNEKEIEKLVLKLIKKSHESIKSMKNK